MTTKIVYLNGNSAEISGSRKEPLHHEDIEGRWRISDYWDMAIVINHARRTTAMLESDHPKVTGEEVGLPFIREISFREREG